MKQVKPPGGKKKEKLKYEAEPMVVLPSVPAESVTQYSIHLASSNADRTLDEMDMLRHITSHLNEIVYSMERVYAEGEEKKKEEEEEVEEEETPPKDEYEDMATFLMCCSQLRNQLESALREEKLILESLLQWFEKEVHEMEELGEERLIPDWQVPMADKNVTDNISKLMDRIQRLEVLKGRVLELPKLLQFAVPKQERRKLPSPVTPSQRDPKHIVEELALKHGTEDVINMAQVFQEDMGPQTIETMTNRMLEIVKVFERQTNKLHRVTNDQEVLEGKLQRIQQEYRQLSEEKEVMEDELQKMKGSEAPAVPETKKKVLAKLEKAKEEKLHAAEKPQKGPLISRHRETEQQMKMKEDLAKAQANVQALEEEKRILQEMLQKASEEAGKVKIQLAEIPPTIPDWQFPYKTAGEDDKSQQRATKPKEPDRTPQRLQKSEILPGKSPDVLTESEAKDIKEQKKGVSLDTEKGLSEGAPASERATEKKSEEQKKKASKFEEMKRRRSAAKGAGKETPRTPLSVPQPAIEVKEEIISETSVHDLITPSSAQLEEITEESELVPPIDSGMTPTPEPIVIMDGRITLTPEEAQAAVGKERIEDFTIEDWKALGVERYPSKIDDDLLGLQEDEIKDTINEKMLQLADYMRELKEMPEAETVASLLLAPGKGMEELSDRQKLQLLNQLITPELLIEDLPQAGILVPDDVADKMKEKQRERKKSLLSSIATSIQLLQQTESPETGRTEEEINERAEVKRVLLANLESNLKDLQQVQVPQRSKDDVDREITNLSEKRNQLLGNLDLNTKDLQEAQDLAAAEPSEMSENQVRELLQQRQLIVANLEANLQELESEKALEATLAEKEEYDKEITKLSTKRSQLLASLHLAMNDLQEAQVFAASEPSETNENKVKELLQQRQAIVANLEANLQDLESSKVLEATLTEIVKNDRKIRKLSEERNQVLAELDSNMKRLQEAHALAAAEPSEMNDYKVKELLLQREQIIASLEDNLQDLETAKAIEAILEEKDKNDREINKLSEKRSQLLASLDLNTKDLQEAQALAATEPSVKNEIKVKELQQQRELIIANLVVNLQDLESAKALEATLAEKDENEKKVNEHSKKRSVLLALLESNLRELQEVQSLEAIEPGSVPPEKIKELTERRKLLTAELETNEQALQKAQASIPGFAEESRFPEMKLHLLSEKKGVLKEKLDSNQKDLEQLQTLATLQPDSVTAEKLQELTEQRTHMNAQLDTIVNEMQEIRRHSTERGEVLKPSERELYELSEKKQLLLKNLEFNRKELQAALELAAIQPGSVTEEKLQDLTKQGQLLNAEIDFIEHEMQAIRRRSSEKERELHKLSEKKQLLLKNLESNKKELQEAQELEATHPGSVSAEKLQELTERGKLLNAEIDTIEHKMQGIRRHSSVAEKELYELSEKKLLLLKKLESSRKELQEVQELAAIHPAEKVQKLTEQEKQMNAEINTIEHKMQAIRRRSSERERELHELSEKKDLLLKNLESSRKELQEAQELEATEPGSVGAEKLLELTEQERLLDAEIYTIEHKMQGLRRRSSERERELHELSEKKDLLLKNLESNRKELEEAQELAATQPEEKLQELTKRERLLNAEIDTIEHKMQGVRRRSSERERELHELSEKEDLLLKNLESNRKELQEAQELEAAEPGSVGAEKMQELTERGRVLNAEIDTIEHEIQEIRDRASEREEVLRPAERKLYELSKKKDLILKKLESNKKKLQEAQELATIQPGTVSENKLQELTEQRKHLTEALKATEQNICETECRALEKVVTVKMPKRELFELSEKKQLLLKNLESNRKELQEAQELAAFEPGSVTEEKLQELTEQERLLNAEIDTVVHEMQEIRRHASGRDEVLSPTERELYELSKKKKHLLKNLESNEKALEEAQELAATQPGSVNEEKVQELTEQGRLLNAQLDTIVHEMQVIRRRDSEKDKALRPTEKELYELLEKKEVLLKNLESKWNELKEAQELAATKPGSVTVRKLKELAEQKKHLTAELRATEQNICEAECRALERAVTVKPPEQELYELLEKKEVLLKNLESNWKELQEAQELAATKPGSISENKLLELIEQRRLLNAEVAETEQSIQEIEHRTSEAKVFVRPSRRELYELSEKKQHLLENLESNWQELQEVQALAATQPGSVTDDKLQELAERREQLTAGLKATVHDIQRIQRLASKTPAALPPTEKELYELSEKKQLLLENLEANWKEQQLAEALAATQQGSIDENKLQELAKQKQRLATDLQATVEEMQKAQHRDIERPIIVRPIVKELYELSEKKQLLLGNLESNEKELREAQALATTHPGRTSDHKLQVLAEQRRNLIADLDTTVNNIHKRQSLVLETLIHPADRDLYELSEKKQTLLKSLKELQEAQATAATQAGYVSADKLKELALHRRRLTADLELTLHGIKIAQSRPATLTASPSEKELYELSEKKQLLMEKLEFNRKELQAAQRVATLQPGTVSEGKIQQLVEQRTRITLEIETIAREIQETLRHTSERAQIERNERVLNELSAKKQLLLENVEVNLKDLQKAYSAAAKQPSGISDKIMQVLNEQTKLLSANLAIVVQDTKELKARISKIGGMKKPIERDVKQLYQKKKMFLECLEMNLKELQEAQLRFNSHPSSSNERRIHDLTELRRLLTIAVEAVLQDLEDVQGRALDKGQFAKSEERILAELSSRKNHIVKSLSSNLKDIKQAQAFAAGHPGAAAEANLKELIEERKILAAGLEGVEQDMQKALSPFAEKVGILKPTDDVSEKRKLDLENIELNIKELKDLHALVASQPDNISEMRMQELNEKQKLLTMNIEKFLHNIRETESDLQLIKMTRPDVRKINDLILLSRLESQLKELESTGIFSETQLDKMKRKIRKIKKQKKSLIDRWEIPLQDELIAAAKLEEYGLNQQEIRELLGRKRSLFQYIRSSIKDLQDKGIIQQSSFTEKDLYDFQEDYLVAVPIELLEAEHVSISARSAIEAERRARQKSLAAKLEANIKDFQSQIKLKSAQSIPITQIEPFHIQPIHQQPMKTVASGLELQITKVPELKKIKSDHLPSRQPELEAEGSFLTQQDKMITKEIQLALKRELLQRSPTGKASLPMVPSLEASLHKIPGGILQQIIDYRKDQLTSQSANLHQALMFAKYQLQQANILAAARERLTAESPTPGTTRFHDYSLQPRKSPGAWEGSMLPQRDYVHKVNLLKKKYAGQEIRGTSAATMYAHTSRSKLTGAMSIYGKGCSVLKSKNDFFPIITKQRIRPG